FNYVKFLIMILLFLKINRHYIKGEPHMLVKEFLNNDDMIDLINYSSDLIAIIDKEGMITFINHAWKRSLSYEKDDLCARNLSEILTLRDHGSLVDLMQSAGPDQSKVFFTAALDGMKGSTYQV